GVYAIIGAYMLHYTLAIDLEAKAEEDIFPIVGLAMVILILAIGTAILLSQRKARLRGEKIWNATSERMLAHMATPLVAGGILILLLLTQGLVSLAIPLSLIFYGIALYNASKFTFEVLKYLGWIQILLGWASVLLPAYGLLLWSIGFGVFHIIYGIYMHIKYERLKFLLTVYIKPLKAGSGLVSCLLWQSMK